MLWGKTAESLAEYLTKGKQIYVEGRLQTRQWDDKDGNKRYTTEIRGDRVVLLSGGGGGRGGGAGCRAAAAPTRAWAAGTRLGRATTDRISRSPTTISRSDRRSDMQCPPSARERRPGYKPDTRVADAMSSRTTRAPAMRSAARC